MEAYVSLKRQVVYRLLAVSAIAIIVVTSASFWLNYASFRKEASGRRSDTQRHFRERLAHLKEDWEEDALRTKTLIELTHFLEDRRSRWVKLNAYLLAQSGAPLFSHIAVADDTGRVLFRFGQDAQNIPSVLSPPKGGQEEYLRIQENLYRVFRLPVWMGADGTAFLILFRPFDNAFLLDLAYPDTDLYVVWQGNAVASSLGKKGVELFSAGPDASDTDQRACEQISLPLGKDAEKGSEAPVLVVRTYFERPFSIIESSVIGLVVFIALIGLTWFVLGTWLTAKVRGIMTIGDAAEQFAGQKQVTPAIKASLAAAGRGRDELEQLGNALLNMMVSIEEYDKQRKNYEAKLVRREQYMRSITASLGEGLYVMDEQGNITYSNTTIRKLLGWTPDELIGRNAHELFHHTKKDGSTYIMEECPIHKATSSAKTLISSDEIFWRRDGSSFPVSLVSSPLTIEGAMHGAVVSFIDITEQKKAEQELKIFRHLLDEINDAVFINDVETGRILDVNRMALARLGYSREELLAMRVIDIEAVLPDDFSWKQHMRELDQRGFMLLEGGHKRKDGIVIPVEMSVRNIVSQGRKFNVAVVRDITERKRIFESLSRMAAIVESSEDAIIGKTLDGIITSWNRGAEMLFGYTQAEVIGKHMTKLYPADRAAEETGLLARIAQGESVEHFETVRIRKDGAPVDISVTLSPIRDPKGRMIGASKIARDISERKRTEKRIRQLMDELQRSNKDLEQFAYVASHDLQEPLRKVSGFAELLAKRYRGQLDEKADTYIDYVLDGASRMSGLINDLLLYSRATTRGKGPAPTDCNAVVSRVMKDLALMIQDNHAEVTFDKLPTIMADETQMGQMLQNLIGNAIKYHSDEPPRVRISAVRREGEWLFSVRDNGIGFEQQHAERIFEIFQRLHTRTEYKGTGIGLAVCKKIVERLGGRIWAESEPGKGSTFFFTVPDRKD